jgi:hypothetical protein
VGDDDSQTLADKPTSNPTPPVGRDESSRDQTSRTRAVEAKHMRSSGKLSAMQRFYAAMAHRESWRGAGGLRGGLAEESRKGFEPRHQL